MIQNPAPAPVWHKETESDKVIRYMRTLPDSRFSTATIRHHVFPRKTEEEVRAILADLVRYKRVQVNFSPKTTYTVAQ